MDKFNFLKIVCFTFIASLGLSACKSGTGTDSSGKITVAVFEVQASQAQSHFDNFAVTVPDDFVAIGGGAFTKTTGAGHMIVSSYPSTDLRSWLVSTKDHGVVDPTRIKAYAIGMKIAGLTREQLMQHIAVNKIQGTIGSHLDVTAGTPSGHILIGGGIKVDPTPNAAGMLSFATYPNTNFSWRIKAKDHIYPASGIATAYAIGIDENIEGVGKLQLAISQQRSDTSEFPESTAAATAGYALTSCGSDVQVDEGEPGSLLWEILPTISSGLVGCTTSSKDHLAYDATSLNTYAIGLKVL